MKFEEYSRLLALLWREAEENPYEWLVLNLVLAVVAATFLSKLLRLLKAIVT